jgi:dephospho-CoA kinase
MIVGITGPLCTGKSVLSKMLIERGFKRISFAEELREEMAEQGMPIERKKLQDFGNEMRLRHGTNYFAKKLIIKMDLKKNYLVEGFRNPGEIEEFRKLRNFVLIGVTAPTELRLKWMLSRNKDNDPKTMHGLTLIDARDRGIGEPAYGQQSGACYEMADRYLLNNTTLEDLKEKAEQLVDELGC